MMKYIVAATAVAFAAASCPNSCNGHGTCEGEDRCSCYSNWIGADCSSQVCPFGISWVGVPGASNDGHAYAECSNKGTCDRQSGECSCFEGFEGEGCERSTCPDNCNGHGTCESMAELASDPAIRVNGHYGPSTNDFKAGGAGITSSNDGNAKGGYGSQRCNENQAWFDNSYSGHRDNAAAGNFNTGSYPVGSEDATGLNGIIGFSAMRAGSWCSHVADVTSQPYDRTYSEWDANKAYACKCDGGYHGVDCSARYCPMGDDPLTVGHEHGYQPSTRVQGIAAHNCDDWLGFPASGATFDACWSHFQFFDHDTSDDDEIQQVSIVAPGAFNFRGSGKGAGFSLVYTDLYGGVWETRNIAVTDSGSDDGDGNDIATVSTADIRAALTTLPNEVIPDCGVTAGTHTDKLVTFQVTFTSPHNSGDQHMLGCNINECSSGCAPYVAGIVGAGTPPSTVHCHVQEIWKGEDEAAECSNRGICDSASGTCECFAGHTDEDCSEMTALI